jgi:glycosyltransferase involved in cell wall biosynthesis
MKILWLCSWYPNKLDKFGGDFVERHAKAIAQFQSLDVIHVVQNHFLLQNVKATFECHQDHNIRFFLKVIPLPKTGVPFLNKIIFNRHYNKQLKKLLDTYIKENGKPDIVHVHVPVKMGVGALYLKEKYHIPFVVTEHNSAYFKEIPENYHQRSKYYRYITRKTCESAISVSSVSDWLLNRLSDLFQVKSSKRIRNVVDHSLFYYSPVNNSIKRFIHVSMMEPLKNVKGIIAAFIELNQQFSCWELVLVGPFPDELKQMIQKGGIEDKVILTGLLPYSDVAAQMRRADALIHFSLYENLPCVINEALCCGLTVISSNVGGIKEIINQHNGMLVRSEDIEALKNAVIHYLNNFSAYNREKISIDATAEFNYNHIGHQLLQWYQELLK